MKCLRNVSTEKPSGIGFQDFYGLDTFRGLSRCAGPVRGPCSRAGQPHFERGHRSHRRSGGMRVRPASALAAFRPVADQAAKRLCISASKLWRLQWCREKESRGHSARSRVCRRAQKQSREDQVEVEVQFGLRAGLAVVEAQVLLGVAEGKLNWKAGPVEVEDVFRHQLGVAAVQQHALPSSAGGPRGAGCKLPATSVARPCPAVRRGTVDLRVRRRCAGHARQVTAVKATVELLAAPRLPCVGTGVAKAQDRVLA